MAIVEVKVPQLSESVAEATLLQWKKKPGEAVALDEILVEIETDKVVLEVPAPAAGVMAQLVKGDGESCVSDEVIAKIDTEAAAQVSPLEVKPAPATTPVAPAPAAAAASTGGSKSDVAMPAAAKIMADNNLAAGSVPGTGKDGRVTKGDVLGALASAPPAAKPAAAPVAAPVAAAVAAVSIRAMTWSLTTVPPSATVCSASTPAAGAGTSSTTLSVSTSIRISSIATASPGFFFHCSRVASATDSDSCGTFTSTIAMFFLNACCGRARPWRAFSSRTEHQSAPGRGRGLLTSSARSP